MAFFQSAVGTLQTLVIALGAGLGIWGAINLMEGYGNDNPGANAHVRLNITLRQSRLSGVARATFPDKQSHLVINYCIMF